MTPRLAAAVLAVTALTTACAGSAPAATSVEAQASTTSAPQAPSSSNAIEEPTPPAVEDASPAAQPTEGTPWPQSDAVTPIPAERAAQDASLATLQTRSIDLAAVARLDDALAMAVRPGTDTVHIARQTGEIHRIEKIGRTWEAAETPMFSLVGRTVANKERGLLGFTFSPDGTLLYAVWTDRDTNDNVLTEYRLDTAGTADNASERIVLRIAQPYANHNGGHIAFGPDGYLYYGLGDGGAANDPLGSGQDTSTLLGAILRIDPLDRSDGAYGIPPSNPFVDGGGQPEIFISGARNPWRFSFDRVTGDLWVADVGQDAFEEITVLRSADGGGAGANLGWNVREGFAEFSDTTEASSALTDPLFAYAHRDGACSITGGFVYRGEALPQIQGAYIYGDWCNGNIWALSQDGQTNRLLDIRVSGRALASFGETPDGEIWILTDGPILALVPEA